MISRRFLCSSLLAVVAVFQATAQTSSGAPRRYTMRPVIRGTHYAASSMDARVSQVIEQVLRAGGNAFDAAVAGQSVLALVSPALNGIGSDAVILIYEAKTKRVISLNAEGTAPRLATIEWYKQNQGGKIPVDDTLLSATVPGVVDAWYTLLDRWGSMTFAQALEPAIELAAGGFPMSERVSNAISGTRALRKYPTSMQVYMPGGKAPAAGEIFRNPRFAATLRRLVEAEKQAASKGRHGALKAARDRFYRGDIAREMADFSEKNSGLFRYEDFASYTVKVEEPIATDYRGYRVYKNPSANQGPVELFALNLLEGYDLKALKHNSAEYIHISAEATKLALADRDKYLGDMDFIEIPYAGLLSKDYATARRKLIDPKRASLELRPGVPEKFVPGMRILNRPMDVDLKSDADHTGDTSYLTLVDQSGNGVSFTPSLHTAFGSKIVLGELGFSLNCRGDYYSLVPGNANALAPGKRPRSTLQSTLVTKDGKLYALMGSPGGDDQCMRTMQTLLNIVEFGMNVQQAIEAPRWTTKAFPASPFPHTMYPGHLGVEATIPQAVRDALVSKGHKLQVSGAWTMGSSAAIVIDSQTGVMSAGADPRVDAYALAW